MDKDDELIARLNSGGNISSQDLESNHENIKPVTESQNPLLNSLHYVLGEKNQKPKK